MSGQKERDDVRLKGESFDERTKQLGKALESVKFTHLLNVFLNSWKKTRKKIKSTSYNLHSPLRKRDCPLPDTQKISHPPLNTGDTGFQLWLATGCYHSQPLSLTDMQSFYGKKYSLGPSNKNPVFTASMVTSPDKLQCLFEFCLVGLFETDSHI